jgi:hypothetical protein
MRCAVLIAVLSAALAGCGKASATEPDSLNPAHCLMALGLEANELSDLGNRADEVKQLLVRVTFETRKAKAAGKTHDETKAEMRDFGWANHFDPAIMHRLASECRTHEDADPAFAEFKRKYLDFMNGKLS